MSEQITPYKTTVYEKAVIKFGVDTQIEKLIEEMGELQSALIRMKHNREHNVPEEFADVEIVMRQLRPVFNEGGEVDFWHGKKEERLIKRVG